MNNRPSAALLVLALVCCGAPVLETASAESVRVRPTDRAGQVDRGVLEPRARSDTGSGRSGGTDTTTVVTTAQPRDDRSEWIREFDRRAKSNKLGYFLDQQQIEAMHPQYTSDALRRVPGVIVRPAFGAGNTVRIRGCAPLIWVDGQRAPGVELDEVTHGSDVAAMEVYRSLAGVPAEFTDRSATCGTILVWLRTN